jgi:hypothetical protein
VLECHVDLKLDLISLRAILKLYVHLRLDLTNGSVPRGFPAKPVITLRATCTAHPNQLNFITRTQFHGGLQIVILIVMKPPSTSLYVLVLRPKYLPPHPFLEYPQRVFLPHTRDHFSHPYKPTGISTVLCVLSFVFWIGHEKTK